MDSQILGSNRKSGPFYFIRQHSRPAETVFSTLNNLKKTEEVMKKKTWWLMGPHKLKSREKPNLLWASAVTQKVRYFLLIILVVYLWKLAY